MRSRKDKELKGVKEGLSEKRKVKSEKYKLHFSNNHHPS
jgi:hypothetical protein